MFSALPSLSAIRAQIQAIRDRAPNAKVFGIFTRERWTGPSLDGTGSDAIALYQCDSPLQMRLALQHAQDTGSTTVLLTPLDQGKVSDDILVRLALRRLHAIKNWEVVRSLFKAKELDPRITRHTFLADVLLECTAGRNFPPVAGGLLDAETVWGILLPERLGLPGAHPDLVTLLRCAAESDLAARWKACPADFRGAATTWIAETAGEASMVVLGCLSGEHGAKVLSIGLAMGVVYHDTVGHELDKAAGRLEAYVGANVPTGVARRWRDAAAIAIAQLPKMALRRCLDDAEAIVKNLGAEGHAWRSSILESGFEQRLSRFGVALDAHVTSRATRVSGELQALYAESQEHRIGRDGGRRMERLTMALRLARWLADRHGAAPQGAGGLLAMAQEYAADTGFVDWTRQVLRGGEPNKDLAAAFGRLVDRVTEIREADNFRFGQALLQQRALGDSASGLMPVEQILEHVVVQAAERAPVLLLLIDGMSWAVFRELLADIKSHDWIDVGIGAPPKRLIGLAALPSVTEVCRTSLLCGALRRGQAADELQGFTTHPRLVAASHAGFMPKLFHKAALEGDSDSGLATEVRAALDDRKQRIVGIVINAVDDYLDKGDQIDAVWTLQHIRALEPILAEASAAGRFVILLSDHGHVLDRHTESREGADGLRWRRSDGSVAKEELEIVSPRVVVPEGGRVVVPWSERLRYGAKKNGYHGGASPQEMLIPISLLWPELHPPEGFGELPVELPLWWTEPAVTLPIPGAAAIPETPRELVGLPLFEVRRAPLAPPDREETWVESLLQCEAFATQKQRMGGRVPVEETTMRRLLVALASRGGSMTMAALAGAVEMPEHRLLGLLAVIQRVLNIEGYPILDRQDAANTVVLNIPLLKKQFELD
jgi:hypothetical protein